MWPNTQFPVDLVSYSEGIVHWKLHFCAVPDIMNTELCVMVGTILNKIMKFIYSKLSFEAFWII